MIKPFLRVTPAALGNRLEEALGVAEQLGHDLDDEQKLALADITATGADGNLAPDEAVVSAPRQSGKSLIAEVFSVMYARRGERVLYTGHRADLAGSIFRRLWATIPDSWGASATFSNGRECIEFPGGGLVLFKTRGQSVGRGDSFHKLVVDEAQSVVAEHLDGVRFAQRALPDTVKTLTWRLVRPLREFGDVRLSDLRTGEIAAWEATLPPRFRHDVIRALRMVLDAAVAWEHIAKNRRRRPARIPHRPSSKASCSNPATLTGLPPRCVRPTTLLASSVRGAICGRVSCSASSAGTLATVCSTCAARRRPARAAPFPYR
jgi:hypothetical protein